MSDLSCGAAAGAVFGALVAVAPRYCSRPGAMPLPLLGQFDVLPVSIRATMPSTALLAPRLGCVGGGALVSAFHVAEAGLTSRP